MATKEEIQKLRERLLNLPKLNDKGRDERVRKSKKDFFFFIKTYFPHYIDKVILEEGETSKFRDYIHKNITSLFKDYKHLEFLAYRGSAKTTTISRLYPLWKLAKRETKFTILVSDTIDISIDNLLSIKIEIVRNQNYRYDFDISEGATWQTEQVTINIEKKLIKIKAYGSGKRIRGANFLGSRPDLIILDDIENDENVESKRQRDKLFNWFKKAILKLPERTKTYELLVIGTILHHDSVLKRIEKRKDFHTVNFPLVISFPRHLEAWHRLFKLDIKEARKQYKKRKIYYDTDFVLDDTRVNKFDVMMEYFEDKDSFMSELQNTPLSKESLIFANYKTYSLLPLKIDAFFIAVDPSLGKSKKGDYFGLGYIAYSKEEKRFYCNINGFKIPAIDMIPKIIDLYIKLSKQAPTTLAIETVAFQDFYKDTVKLFAKSSDIHIPIIEIKNTSSKEGRIQSIAPLVRDHTFVYHTSNIIMFEELDTYPKSPHDDLLDTNEMAYRCFSGRNKFDFNLVKNALKNYKFLNKNKGNKYA